MKKLIIAVGALLFMSPLVSAQGGSTPYPQNTPDPVFQNPQIDSARRRADDLNRRSDELKMTQNLPVEVPPDRGKYLEVIKPLYRKSTDEEGKLMSPDEAVLGEYADFLSQKNTGAFKLVADKGCADNQKVVVSSADCSLYTMPGAGSGYSFRFGDYRMHHLADIVFRNIRFESLGVMNHGIMTELGDVRIQEVSAETEGIRYLEKIKPSKDFTQAADLANKLSKGIKEKGRTYASILPVNLNSTYVLRSIAYDGKVLRNVGGFVYNELELDKRRDVLVVFRVVMLSEGEDVTIVWKELKDKKAPKLKPDKE